MHKKRKLIIWRMDCSFGRQGAGPSSHSAVSGVVAQEKEERQRKKAHLAARSKLSFAGDEEEDGEEEDGVDEGVASAAVWHPQSRACRVTGCGTV